MKKFFKIFLISLLVLIILGIGGISFFVYKVKYGLPIFETEAPALPDNLEGFSVLVFSKTNGFRHGEAIDASLKAFDQMAEENGWSMFQTDNGAVFRIDLLAEFDVVIWNNASGRVLTPEQREAFRGYIESGGGFVGIHAAGDDSHHWDWYQDKLVGAHFSHHPIDPHIQESTLTLETDTSHLSISEGLEESWTRSDEWYVFYDNPRLNDKTVLYNMSEEGVVMSGNMGFLVKDKDYGMGEDHPIVWYSEIEEGRSVYSALGHTGTSFEEGNHLKLLKNAILWAGKAH